MARRLLLFLAALAGVLLLAAEAHATFDPTSPDTASAHVHPRPVVATSPAVAATSRPAGPSRVPILMYHAIGTPSAKNGYPSLWVDPSEFAAEMAWLHGAGFTGVTLQQWWDSWHGGAALPARPVVISFDDGFSDWFTAALPVLNRYHWPADIELIVSHDNSHNVTPEMVSTLVHRYGWELDSHTETHPHLDGVSARQLRQEVAGSRQFYQRLGYTVNFFCYPFGQYNARVLAAVRAAGYLGATTVVPGVASSTDDPYELPRISVPRGLGASGLEAKFKRFGVVGA